ncbi:hypothetical protein CI610_03751 [invertebrate metagenome]|uniref:Uncharacterized protein n=1 Tax=invertebrate metagenome TaxID=1711999 RepID=A0A2H9T285_9ZZZZ
MNVTTAKFSIFATTPYPITLGHVPTTSNHVLEKIEERNANAERTCTT